MNLNNANNNIQDPGRLDVLRETRLLDTPAEECFDRLTRLAAEVLDVPVSLICLADEGRDFYKSSFGLTSALTGPRGLSGETLCRRTLQSAHPVVIDDVLLHEEYRRGPMVETLGVRAYLAVPLNVRGAVIGSFGVIDISPRRWSEADVEIVDELARSTVREIELRLALRAAEARRARRSAHGAEDDRGLVLVADDDPAMRRLIIRSLAGDGYEIAEARDGRETLEIMQERDIDVLLLDLIMPNLSGWDVLKRRADDERLRHVPVIVISARRGPDVARAVASGIYGLVPKPFDAGDLRDLVKTCFTERRSTKRSLGAGA